MLAHIRAELAGRGDARPLLRTGPRRALASACRARAGQHTHLNLPRVALLLRSGFHGFAPTGSSSSPFLRLALSSPPSPRGLNPAAGRKTGAGDSDHCSSYEEAFREEFHGPSTPPPLAGAGQTTPSRRGATSAPHLASENQCQKGTHKIGVFSYSSPLDRRQMFAWCAECVISDVELVVGPGPLPLPHLESPPPSASRKTRPSGGRLKSTGWRLAAFTARNLLHPDTAKRQERPAPLSGPVASRSPSASSGW